MFAGICAQFLTVVNLSRSGFSAPETSLLAGVAP
jgi:hypothetical protein